MNSVSLQKFVELGLNPSEFYAAATMGLMRQVTNLRDGRQDRYGCSQAMGWQHHIEGACGEAVVAKWLGVYWSGALGNLNATDIEGLQHRLQVRTAPGHNHHLLLHPGDGDNDFFISVTGMAPNFRIGGWLPAREGKISAFWGDKAKNNRPAFFVPQHALRSPAELLALINKK